MLSFKKITFFLSIKYYIFIPRPLGIVVLSLEPKVILGSNKQKEEKGGNILWWMLAGVVQWWVVKEALLLGKQ